MAAMMTPLKQIPLIAPVTPVFANAATDNDALKNSERKRPQHQMVAAEFSAGHKNTPVAAPESPAALPASDSDTQKILTYGYNPLTKEITFETFAP